jgi:hypothetical protein
MPAGRVIFIQINQDFCKKKTSTGTGILCTLKTLFPTGIGDALSTFNDQ